MLLPFSYGWHGVRCRLVPHTLMLALQSSNPARAQLRASLCSVDISAAHTNALDLKFRLQLGFAGPPSRGLVTAIGTHALRLLKPAAAQPPAAWAAWIAPRPCQCCLSHHHCQCQQNLLPLGVRHACNANLGRAPPDAIIITYDPADVDQFIGVADALEAAFPNAGAPPHSRWIIQTLCVCRQLHLQSQQWLVPHLVHLSSVGHAATVQSYRSGSATFPLHTPSPPKDYRPSQLQLSQLPSSAV